MTARVISDSENDCGKCLYNGSGFCIFRSECRNQHFQEVCQTQNCDRKCLNRHPKSCKFKGNCKFMKKNICAFSHSKIDQDVKIHDNKIHAQIKELEDIVKKQKLYFDNRVKSLEDKLDIENKKNEKIFAENEKLQNLLKHEIKDLNSKMEN